MSAAGYADGGHDDCGRRLWRWLSLCGLPRRLCAAACGRFSLWLRRHVLRACAWMGAELDAEANRAGAEIITTPASRLQALVLPTDEQIVIARAARALLQVA